MYQELLLALHGHVGGLFVESYNSKTGEVSFRTLQEFPGLHTSEIILINRIISLGYYYREFEKFLTDHSLDGSIIDSSAIGIGVNESNEVNSSNKQITKDVLWASPGLYIQALCTGIEELLNHYNESLLIAEERVLSSTEMNKKLPLSWFMSHFHDQFVIFPKLFSDLVLICKNKYFGGALLGFLVEQSVSGIPLIQSAYERLISHLHRAFLQQTIAWSIHGLLIDSYDEYFISRSGSSITNDPLAVPGSPTDPLAHLQAPPSPYSDARLATSSTTILSSTSPSITSKSIISYATSGKNRNAEQWDSLYGITMTRLPSHIPLRIAEKVLFIGKAVQVLELSSDEKQLFSSRLAQLQSQPKFTLCSFESVIDDIRSQVAEGLCKLVIEDSNLITHLHTLKQYFLLGRGDFYQVFLDEALPLFSLPLTSKSNHDIDFPFQQAALKSTAESDPLFKYLKLSVSDLGSSSSVSHDPWYGLVLEYKAQWPLTLLFVPSIMEKYNRVFRFLVYIKRAQVKLQQCWAHLMSISSRGTSSMTQKDALLGSAWRLRSSMSFLLDNLQFYLQMDVIEVQFQKLVNEVKGSKDFEAIQKAHELYLAALMNQSFFHIKPVRSAIYKILAICIEFSDYLMSPTAAETLEAESFEGYVGRVSKAQAEFSRHTLFLFTILSGVSTPSAPQLSQFLLRIDFNRFFSNLK